MESAKARATAARTSSNAPALTRGDKANSKDDQCLLDDNSEAFLVDVVQQRIALYRQREEEARQELQGHDETAEEAPIKGSHELQATEAVGVPAASRNRDHDRSKHSSHKGRGSREPNSKTTEESLTIPGAYSDVPGQEKTRVHRTISSMSDSSCLSSGLQEEEQTFVNETNEDATIDNYNKETYLTSAELVVEPKPQTLLEAQPVTYEHILCKFLQSPKGSFLLLGLALLAIGLVISFLMAMLVWQQATFAFTMALGIVLLLAMAVQLSLKVRHPLQRRISLLVIVSLVLMVVVSVYKSTQHWETLHFQFHFDILANQLVHGFHDHAIRQLQTMDMLSIGIMSTATATHQSFPFVTIPDFAARATAAMALLGSKHVLLYPYVTQETRIEWEDYSMNHMEWINASRAFQQEFLDRHSPSISEGNNPSDNSHHHEGHRHRRRQLEIPEADYLNRPAVAPPVNRTAGTDGASPKIFRYGRSDHGESYLVVDDTSGPYYPMWQLSPVRDETELYINYNCLDPYYGQAYTDAIESVRQTQSVVFGGVWNVGEDGTILENANDYDIRTEPAAGVIYPVFDHVLGNDRQNGTITNDVVAVLEFDIEFGGYFSDILSNGDDSNGIICVVSNPCRQSFTYLINGASATYLGATNSNSHRYDHDDEDLVLSTLLTDFPATGYNGAPVNKEYCPWTLSVYPGEEFKAVYLTHAPLSYACVVLGVFMFTCLVLALTRVVGRDERSVPLQNEQRTGGNGGTTETPECLTTEVCRETRATTTSDSSDVEV